MSTERSIDRTIQEDSLTFTNTSTPAGDSSISLINTSSGILTPPIIPQPKATSFSSLSPTSNVSGSVAFTDSTLNDSYVDSRSHHVEVFVPETQETQDDTTPATVSDETLLDTKDMIECSTCKSWCHYQCTSLPLPTLRIYIYQP